MKKVKIKKCPICEADGYVGLDGKFMHGKYLGKNLKKP